MDADAVIRPLALGDAETIAALQRADRDFLAPWDPTRPEGWFTAEGQREEIAAALERVEHGSQTAWVIVDGGEAVGRVNLNGIVRGAFQSATLGYRLAEDAGGRGLATRAVEQAVLHAFGELGLHRVDAGTLPENDRSQRLLRRLGFERYGLAPGYLRIAGAWRDHVLFQRLAPGRTDRDPDERFASRTVQQP